MIGEKHLTIHGREVSISSREEYQRLIIRAKDKQTGKTILAGNYDPSPSLGDAHLVRFLNNVRDLLQGHPNVLRQTLD